MNTDNLELAKQKLQKLEKLQAEELKLKKENEYLPKTYNDDNIKKQIDLIEYLFAQCQR